MKRQELKRFSLLAELDDGDRDALLDVLDEHRVSAGVALFREGSEAEGLVLVSQGQVRLESRRSGQTWPLTEGAALGALSLVVVGAREVSAIAETPCRYLMLPRTAFRRLVDDAPRTACRLAEAIVSETAAILRESLDELGTG